MAHYELSEHISTHTHIQKSEYSKATGKQRGYTPEDDG